MTISLFSSDLSNYLQSHHGFEIVGQIDIDWLISQPRKTLFFLFSQWHKNYFESNERIILFSRQPISMSMLSHIQKCACQVDISNFFILLCCPGVNNNDLELVRNLYSTDSEIFSTMQINFQDPIEIDLPENLLISLPESFCFVPWAHLEISSEGEFRPCCVYREPITDEHGKVYNINDYQIDQVYQSQYLQDLRSQFINGERPSGCTNCWYKESTGGRSNRHWFTDHLGLKANLLEIESIRCLDNLVSLDIKMGNLCNFKCRICNPVSSSRIAEERVKYFQSSIDLKSLNAKGRWVENQEIWKTLKKLGKQLVNIDFYGGEPFLIKQHELFLDYLIQNQFSNKIRLHYNSNGSIYPEKLFEKWQHFREVDIAFSIDDVGPRFEFQRGGSWDDINNNMEKFFTTKLSNMILSVFATVNVQNIYYINELIEWVETKKFNDLIFHLLETPKFLSITSMGPELTRKVLRKLDKIDENRSNKYNVNSLIKIMRQNTKLKDMTKELQNFMQKLDHIRKEDFVKTHPEVANIIYKGK